MNDACLVVDANLDFNKNGWLFIVVDAVVNIK